MKSGASIDPSLVGCWRVVGMDMVDGRMVTLLAGLPGEIVEFSADGRYVVDVGPRGRPSSYGCRTFRRGGLSCLDEWQDSLPTLVTRCVYRLDGDRLSICIAGDHGPRPKALRRDDERLRCVMTLDRTDCPRRKRPPRKLTPLLKPGVLIPDAFLDKRATVRRRPKR